MQIFITAAGWNEELPLQNFHISGIKAKVNKAGSIIFTEDFHLEDVRLQVEDGSRVEEKTIRTHKSISAMKQHGIIAGGYFRSFSVCCCLSLATTPRLFPSVYPKVRELSVWEWFAAMKVAGWTNAVSRKGTGLYH